MDEPVAFDAADWRLPDDLTGTLISLGPGVIEDREPRPGEMAVTITTEGVIEVREV